ncbi:RNA polymerase II subunit A C-terminal domain phosphatase SSU72 [Trichinella patagoniensis]|uniref:RNA polymerase II subunit A C-terminal domain phosphatase SSU72 n=1 Tax=Trichinella patagoniensis TaxID=990121 RepID=A0A0V0ZM42_9BILA|nr:RNA polymerase II subunit A C-terminal domain phosphatase SSU72 [Trichinella patagoniensis]
MKNIEICIDFEIVKYWENKMTIILMNTEMKHCHLVHIINVDIRDNHEEATCGALLFCHLCTLLEKSADLDNEIEEILSNFENICKRTILHTLELKRNSVTSMERVCHETT